MATTRARVVLPLLAGAVILLRTVLLATPAPAVQTEVTAVIKPNAAEGAGFGLALLGETSQLTATVVAPMDWTIIQITERDGGGGFWAPADGNPDLPAGWQSWEAYGIGRNNDHTVGFYGKIAHSGPVPGGTPPDFDVAVADLWMASHEITQSDGNGLPLAPSMVTGSFPSTLPANTGVSTTFTVKTQWGGPQSSNVGSVTFSVPSGVAIYNASGDLITSMARIVPSSGLSNEQITIVTNESFTGSGTITATFTWVSPYAADSASAITAVDYLRVAPPSITVCGVGFSGSGYNAMNKTGTGGYFPYCDMTYEDDGDTPVGRWRSDAWPTGSPLYGDDHLWHYLSIPGYSGTDPACFTGGSTPHVAVLVYVSTPLAISTLRVRGEVSNTNPVAYMTGSTGSVPAGNSYKIVESDLSSQWTTTVWNGTLDFDWYYDLNDRPTPNVQFYPSGDYPVFVTFGTPTGTTATAKRVDWCTQLASGQDTLAKIGDAVGPDAVSGSRFGSHSIFADPDEDPDLYLSTAWQIMDGMNADCGSLSTLMKYELDMLGATGSQVLFVYACHNDWSHLSSSSTTANEIDSGRILGMYFGTNQHSAGTGWNNYEGCCVFQSKWWMGGLGTSKADAKAVLKWVVRPNNADGTADSHQCYYDDQLTYVDYAPE